MNYRTTSTMPTNNANADIFENCKHFMTKSSRIAFKVRPSGSFLPSSSFCLIQISDNRCFWHRWASFYFFPNLISVCVCVCLYSVSIFARYVYFTVIFSSSLDSFSLYQCSSSCSVYMRAYKPKTQHTQNIMARSLFRVCNLFKKKKNFFVKRRV